MAATWNPADKHANIALSLGDLRATTDDASGSGYWGVRATEGKASGKPYFEIVCVLPWDFIRIGVANLSQSLSGYPGDSTNSWGYAASTGKKYYNGAGTAYGNAWTDGDVIGVALDRDNGKIWFSINGVWQASGDPAAGTNPAYTGLSGTLYPMAGPYGSNGDSIHVDAVFALQDFQYTPPSGFSAWDPLTVEVEAGIGIEAVVVVDTFSDAIEAGVGIQAQVAVQSTNNVEVIAGVGIEAQVAVEGIYQKAITAGIGIEAEVSVFNWAEWIAIYEGRYTARYYFTLTGAADGLADVVIPMSSFQYRLRDDTPSYLQVIVPGTDSAGAITARSNGDLIIELAYLIDGVEHYREQLAAVDFESVRTDEGTKSQSIILSGHRTDTWGAQTVTIQGRITYRSENNGQIRLRKAVPDLWLRPGDTVIAGDDTFVVGQVMSAMAKATQWTEIVEAI
ncbi:hypothetical protein LCGC14_1570430 [marine sediment metagenome]|uniref:B30.2/SPRY domain-containing protein n=1 Tax=marine sediment metagenome TaxID=412755 RepID=A0A0F9IJS8_9ZZZZ